MSHRKIAVVVVATLVVGVFAGATGAQIIQLKMVNSGLATVGEHETMKFHYTLEDVSGAPPAVVSMQLLDQNGAVVAKKIATLTAGQSTTLESPGPGLMRAHADVIDSVPTVTARRTGMGSAEVHNTLTGIIRHVCSFDVVGVGGGRN